MSRRIELSRGRESWQEMVAWRDKEARAKAVESAWNKAATAINQGVRRFEISENEMGAMRDVSRQLHEAGFDIVRIGDTFEFEIRVEM